MVRFILGHDGTDEEVGARLVARDVAKLLIECVGPCVAIISIWDRVTQLGFRLPRMPKQLSEMGRIEFLIRVLQQ
jgi:hypothetical protein